MCSLFFFASRETLSDLQTHLRELTEDHARKAQALSLDQGGTITARPSHGHYPLLMAHYAIPARGIEEDIPPQGNIMDACEIFQISILQYTTWEEVEDANLVMDREKSLPGGNAESVIV